MMNRQIGKSILTEQIAFYAIESNKNLLIATSKPEYWYNRLNVKFPNAKLKIVKEGIEINPK